MNEREAIELVSRKLGLTPDMIPFLSELALDMTIINPTLPATAKRLGRIMDLRPGKKVLDLGCGKAGLSLPWVHIYQVKLTGVDAMPDFIREAWARAEHAGLIEFCDFHLDDAARFVATTKKQWDAVIIAGNLPHIWSDEDAGLKAARGLIPVGGYMVIGLPYLRPDGEQDQAEPQRTKDEITAWLEKHGKVVDILDDGEEGWRAYVEPMKRAISRLKSDQPGRQSLADFLDTWGERMDWESRNLGFALWVVRVE
ncbi:MAG: class I SAM-dependent methyltransferase [Thermodesulfobacteriota bacterium]